MKKIALLLLAIGGLMASCSKSVYTPVSYSVENEYGTAPKDIYMPANGNSANVDIVVKFLTGSATDSVTLSVVGLPAGITVTPQTATGLPTYYYNYIYTTTNMAVGSYPVSIVSSAPHTAAKTYNFNLVVLPNNCASLFSGNYSGSNGCTSRGYTYAATGVAADSSNTVVINNFGGYGLNTNTTVIVNCITDSLTIAAQNIGNGITMQGSGTFTGNGNMVITYSAVTTPGAAAENCTATLTKN